MALRFEILDCTLRDGGYSNDWHFDKSAASRLLEISEKNGCNYFEIGFRFASQAKSRVFGPFAFSTLDLLNEVTRGIKRKVKVGFMINADDFEGMPDEGLKKLLGKKEVETTNDFDFVRVAARPGKLDDALDVCEFLVGQGYQVMVNLMQAHNYDESELKGFADRTNFLTGEFSEGYLSHIYVADTMGSMTPKEVSKKIGTLAVNSDCEIGFHGHDNLRLALANSLEAIEAGASLIDGTLTGIGRGIGNTRVELLYLMRERDSDNSHLTELITLGADFYAEDKNTYIQESSYAISGALQVHPNYVDAILQNGEKHFQQIPEVFSELTAEEKSSFSKFGADLSSIWYSVEKRNKEENLEELEGESFLLVAPGQTATKYKLEIAEFAKSKSIPVGTLSSKQDLPTDLVDYFFCSYPLTFLTGQFGNPFNSRVVAPFSSIPDEYINSVKPESRIEYGLRVSEREFAAEKNYLIASSARVHLYAISYLATHGIQNIYLAGFDGYPGNDSRNNEFMDSIRRVRELYPDLSFRTLTPTKYDLDTEQLFS